MPKAKVLIIEGKHSDRPVFSAELQKKGFTVQLVESGTDALKRVAKFAPDMVVINAASMRSTGVRTCQSLREKDDSLPLILVIDANKTVDLKIADVVLNLPFTAQKLVNRMRPYYPGDSKNAMHAGPIRLDVEQRRVRCLGKSARLTPRLVALLKMLMEKKGEVVGREDLFKKVWETNYTGDTRTLDVHISWLRQALEIDPDNPRFLHTVRGVGYRLDV
jgi:DNA-binding response OmpR family regulator